MIIKKYTFINNDRHGSIEVLHFRGYEDPLHNFTPRISFYTRWKDNLAVLSMCKEKSKRIY